MRNYRSLCKGVQAVYGSEIEGRFTIWWTCQILERLIAIRGDSLVRNSKDLVGTPRTLELIPRAFRRFNYSMLARECMP